MFAKYVRLISIWPWLDQISTVIKGEISLGLLEIIIKWAVKCRCKILETPLIDV
jgi:hypothetical protein